ncbi:Ribosomal protein S10 [Morus notabilis]|uniref:Ribosomal protein S10 n=1 Tax=Morus notabilis TaxID=981085 RepID=W9QRR6_9ROSA|nr:Ribosomal protein S10 [Morus notabilis]
MLQKPHEPKEPSNKTTGKNQTNATNKNTGRREAKERIKPYHFPQNQTRKARKTKASKQKWAEARKTKASNQKCVAANERRGRREDRKSNREPPITKSLKVLNQKAQRRKEQRTKKERKLVSAFGKVESLKPLHRLNSPARIKSKGFLLKPGPQICVVIRYFDRLPVENRSADPKKKIASPPKMTNPKITITLTNTERPCLDDRLPGRRVRLPETRRLYTLLRSPHVHKKSREQFWIRTNKQCLVIQTTEKDEWKRKLFWLKNGRAFL